MPSRDDMKSEITKVLFVAELRGYVMALRGALGVPPESRDAWIRQELDRLRVEMERP